MTLLSSGRVSSLFWFSLLFFTSVRANEETHSYLPSESIKVWSDRIGPLANPSETYPFVDFPICDLWKAEGAIPKDLSLSEALTGHSYILNPRLNIKFPDDEDSPDKAENASLSIKQEICRMRLTSEATALLSDLVSEEYWAEYMIDGLPIFGLLGMTEAANETGESLKYIYTQRTFVFERNGNQIITADMIPSSPQLLTVGSQITLTYHTLWMSTTVRFANRLNHLQTKVDFVENTHLFSIINSCIMAIILCGLLMTFLYRSISRDNLMNGASAGDLEESRMESAFGWRIVATEVSRKPKNLSLLMVLYSSGWQILGAIFFIFVVSSWRVYRNILPYSSPLVTLMCYTAAQPLNGFFGVRMSNTFGGKNPTRIAFYQFIFFPAIVSFMFLQVNSAATALGSSLALSFSFFFKLFEILLLAGLVCQPIGYFFGRSQSQSGPGGSKRVYSLQRPIPQQQWGLKFANVAMCSLVPTCCLFFELHLLFSSFWGIRTYLVLPTMAPIAFLYVIILASLSAMATYLLLSSEDYRWQWFSFVCGFSSIIPLFLYSIHFFFAATAMRGFFQTLVYFSFSTSLVLAVALASGALSFASASLLIRRMYANAKAE